MEQITGSTETKTYSVEISLEALKAIRLFAAKEDVRNWLKGVAISPHGDLVATNGHMAGALRGVLPKGLPWLVIPNAAIDTFVRGITSLVKTYRPRTLPVLVRWEQTYTADFSIPKDGVLVLTLGDKELFTFPFKPEVGRYPDYTRFLCPDLVTPYGNPQFNVDYLVTFNKAYLLFNPKASTYFSGVHLTPQGISKAARVRLVGVPQFEGAVMPLTIDKGKHDQHADCVLMDNFVGNMKRQLVQALDCDNDFRHWQDPVRFNESRLNRMFHERVADGDTPGAANILMMLHTRGEKLTPYDASQDLRKVA